MAPSTQHPAPSTRHSFRLIVFDLDGTLIDSRKDLADSVNALLVDCGAAPLPEDQVGRMVGDGAATLVARAFEASGRPRPADALERFLGLYAARLTEHTRPYPSIPDVLASLRGRATLAVLTNKPLASTRTILARLDLAQFFDPALVLGGDGPLPRKPDPSGLQWLMSRAGADAASTILIGDSVIDWKTAHAAGAAIALAEYGFGFEGFPEELIGPGDFRIESPSGFICL